MQRPWGKICDLKQVWYHLIPQWHLHKLTVSTGALSGPSVTVTHKLLWPRLVPLCALKLYLRMEGAFIPDGRTQIWRKRHCVFLPSLALSGSGVPVCHGHSRFVQFPDFLYGKRHLGHTLPRTKKPRDDVFALGHFGYIHLGFGQPALPWRVFFSLLQL